MKILITGGTSATALKLLKAFSSYDVILADYGEVPKFASTNYQLVSLGEKNLDTVAHSLLNNCLDLKVDMILPLSRFEIEAVVKSVVLFNEFDIEVLLPSMENLQQFVVIDKQHKHPDWVVFLRGELVFSTSSDEQVIALGKTNKLSGAFYFNNGNLTLIAI